MKKQSKAEAKKLAVIAMQSIPELAGRGDLERHWSDEADFFETSVWSLKEALEKAYELGKQDAAKK